MKREEFNTCKKEVEEALREREAGEEEWSDGTVRQILEALILETGRKHGLTLTEKEELLTLLFNRFRRLDQLQPLLEDEEVTDILINGGREVFVERQEDWFLPDICLKTVSRSLN